jgi:Na+/melibiose symporter-like transporter
VFLFLTYYLQETLGYSPVKTGLAFIPMIALLVVVATASTAKLLPKFGPKYLVALGMFVAAGGMLMLSRVSINSSYTGVVLPALLILGAGLGGVMAPSMNTATAGVSAADAGVASATVNTSQQIGGSIGTALLNTLAASAGTAFLAGKVLSRQVLAEAAVHSYITAFRWSALVFAIGGVLAALLLKPGAPKLDNSQPMVMH